MLEFWLFVLATAGIYTIFSLGLLVQFGIAGVAQLRQRRLHGDRGLYDGDHDREVRAADVVAAPLGIVAAVIFGLILAIPTVRLRTDYLGVATIAAGEIVRYLALNLQDVTGGAAGTVNSSGQASPPTTMPSGCACSGVRGLLSAIAGLRVSLGHWR